MQRGLEWAAGLFEGEGSFCINSHKSKRNPEVRWPSFVMSMGSMDRDVLEEFYRIIGVGKIYTESKPRPSGKVYHYWRIGGQPAIEAAYKILPYLGERRVKRFHELYLIILEHQTRDKPSR